MNYQRQFQYNEEITGQFIDVLNANSNDSEAIGVRLSHVLTALHFWVSRMNGTQPAYGVWQALTPVEMISLNREVHEQIFTLLEGSNLYHICNYTSTSGKSYSNTFDEIFTHLIIHSAHHRAQIAMMWREKGIEPPINDFVAWARTK